MFVYFQPSIEYKFASTTVKATAILQLMMSFVAVLAHSARFNNPHAVTVWLPVVANGVTALFAIVCCGVRCLNHYH